MELSLPYTYQYIRVIRKLSILFAEISPARRRFAGVVNFEAAQCEHAAFYLSNVE
jgi:hypothetical protein